MRVVALAGVSLALFCGEAHASPLELFGFGARSPGLAGTGVASTNGYESVYLNPAGLARVPRKRATIGFLAGDFGLRINGDDTGTESATGLQIGGELPMPLGGPMKDRLGLGFGFYVPQAAINRARAPFPGTPEYVLLENRSHVLALQVAVGVKLKPHLDAGLGVIALAILRGNIAVSTDAAGRFTTDSEERLLTRFAPVAGVTWHKSDTLDLGAVVRWTSRSDYDIDVTTDVGDVVPITLPPIKIAGNAQFDPLTGAIEAAWRQRPDLLLSAQLQWQHWSSFPLPTENPVTGTPAQEPPNFHDTVNPRVSAEWTRGAWRVRGGLAFLMSPAPAATGQQSLLDNHRVVGAAGVGLALPKATVPLFVDAFVQFHELIPRHAVKEMDLQVLDTKGHIVVGGISVGVAL